MLAQSIILALAVPTLAVPFSSYVLHEKREVELGGLTTRVPDDSIIPIKIGLTQSNLDSVYDHLMDVSNPSSSNYGKHWTVDEVHATYAPSDETVNAIKEWLVSSGVDASAIRSSHNRGWLAVDMPAHQAQSLFKTEYFEHENVQDGTVRLGCDSYYLPGHLSQHVDFVKPGITLSAAFTKRTVRRTAGRRYATNGRLGALAVDDGFNSTPPKLPSCGTAITPACIKAMYDIPNATVSAKSDLSNKLGILEVGDQYLQEDLDLFFKNFSPNVPQGTAPTSIAIDGFSPVATTPGKNVQGEADVDVQIGYSLIFPQEITVYEQPQLPLKTKKSKQEDSYISLFLDAIDGSYCESFDKGLGTDCGLYNLTRVVSVSYGISEFHHALAGSFGAQRRACNEIAKLGLQGTTFVVSSGDYGVGATPLSDDTNGCAAVSSSGIKPQALSGHLMAANFPQNCPFVLSVGATQLNKTQVAGDPESVMNPKNGTVTPNGINATFSSAGGFSNVFARPSYQDAAVGAYFSQHEPGYPYYHTVNGTGIGANGGVYNRGGRGFPDVSANGAQFQTFSDERLQPIYGTSLAAPIWASLITLINEERCAAGKGPVGFINPTLYANPSAFHDIVHGHNAGCNTNGFEAVSGWEPATGLGTPDFPSLLKVFMSLP